MNTKSFTFDLQKAVEAMRSRETPPPPSGAGLREWFAGIALSNSELMKDIAPEARAEAAAKIADDLIRALSAPRPPSNTEIKLTERSTVQMPSVRQDRVTQPDIRPARLASIVPPPVTQESNLPPFGDIGLESKLPGVLTPKPNLDAGRYSIVPDEKTNE